ncbi:hypothetical protein HZC53_01035 [Candidatus Uhrbacteria bacterium]|nr:hypothetical protein [Candidatus Uhrbacteria bacterium]
MRKFWLWILPLAFVLGWITPAQAGDITPVEGRDYWILPKCDKGTCVKIAPNINLNTPLFAAQLKTTPYAIRKDNPTGTIALCHRPGDGYRMGTINKPEDRADDSVWASCPNAADQYVYILPGQTIKISGRVHLSFNEQQKILNDIKECKTQECVDESTAKLNPNVKRAGGITPPPPAVVPITPPPPPPASASAGASESPAAGSTGTTVVEVTRMPDWGWMLISLLTLVSITFISLYTRLVFRMMEIVKEQVDVIQQNSERVVKQVKDQLEGMGAKLTAQGELLTAATEEAAEQNKKFTQIRSGLLDYAKKELLPVPQTASLVDIWTLISQHFDEIARENGDARDAKLRAENAKAEAEKAKDTIQASLDNQVAANQKLTAELEAKNNELGVANSALGAIHRNCDRIGELNGLLAPHDVQLIQVDNEVTELLEPYTAKRQKFEDLAASGDPRAPEVRVEVEAMESRIRHLYGRREVLVANTTDWRNEFDNLFLQMNGFALNAVPLYEEAQRDRNDAARVKGEALALRTQAQAMREGAEAHIKQREAQLKAENDTHFAERTASFQDWIDGLVERETKVAEREAALQGLPGAEVIEEVERLGQNLTEAIAERDALRSKLEEVDAKLQAVNEELARYKTSNAKLADELGEARANSRRFESERQKLSADLEMANAKIGELDEELTGVRLRTPAPVPVIQPIVTPPARPTVPYSSPDTRTGVAETFFGHLSALMAAPTRLVVNTPQKVWLLHDLLVNLRVEVRLEDLFPDGPQSSSHSSDWEKLCTDFRRATLDKVAYIVTELGLPPPQGYRPLALAGGT